MKVHYFILIGIVSLFLFSVTSGAYDWRPYGKTYNGKFYYDAETIRQISKNVMKVWVKTEYSPEGVEFVIKTMGQKYSELSYLVSSYKIDCAEQKFMITESAFFAHDGSIIYSWKAQDEWSEVLSNSITALLLKAVCQKQKKAKRPKR